VVKGRAGLIDDDGNGLIRVSRIEACGMEWRRGRIDIYATDYFTCGVVVVNVNVVAS
jgi:hypothetical protein